jgi:hypothetical protein
MKKDYKLIEEVRDLLYKTASGVNAYNGLTKEADRKAVYYWLTILVDDVKLLEEKLSKFKSQLEKQKESLAHA